MTVRVAFEITEDEWRRTLLLSLIDPPSGDDWAEDEVLTRLLHGSVCFAVDELEVLRLGTGYRYASTGLRNDRTCSVIDAAIGISGTFAIGALLDLEGVLMVDPGSDQAVDFGVDNGIVELSLIDRHYRVGPVGEFWSACRNALVELVSEMSRHVPGLFRYRDLKGLMRFRQSLPYVERCLRSWPCWPYLPDQSATLDWSIAELDWNATREEFRIYPPGSLPDRGGWVLRNLESPIRIQRGHERVVFDPPLTDESKSAARDRRSYLAFSCGGGVRPYLGHDPNTDPWSLMDLALQLCYRLLATRNADDLERLCSGFQLLSTGGRSYDAPHRPSPIIRAGLLDDIESALGERAFIEAADGFILSFLRAISFHAPEIAGWHSFRPLLHYLTLPKPVATAA